ncbi:membrane-bound metal-dependent hydrolase [Halorubrum californiense DSM 19288]|uniref:Membrane-bound metal-dependent hydrolase n=1 Tax=Halorubrum californiense DSM 19288 TaxID=1227465 RepID=M0DUJ3_9EURY|nr:metal-dependent hydrolase [Halorubrum californiense]ELZ39185.1 membrane-bound metal-dependent hydrolase [Halorubrum californiense DSM 19288]
MFPIEHFIVAVVPVVAYVFVRDRHVPTGGLLAVVFVGSQLPDLIDKPLAHQFGLLPSGRVFVHSLPIAVPLCCLTGWYAWRTDRLRAGGAFAFAYGTHVITDNHQTLSPPNPTLSDDMLWPFRPAAPRPDVPYWAGEASINVRLWTLFSALVLTVTVYYLYRDVNEQLRSSP